MRTMEDDLRLREFAPRPTLAARSTTIARPRFTVIDAHNHLGQLVPSEHPSPWARRPVNELVEELDRAGVQLVVDLDGGIGENLRREIARYVEPYPERFIVFA